MANVDAAGEEYARKLLETVESIRRIMRDIGDLLSDTVIGDAEWWKDWHEERAALQAVLVTLRGLPPHREWRLSQEKYMQAVQELVGALTDVSRHEHDLNEQHLREAFSTFVTSTRHLEAALSLQPHPRVQN